MLDNEIMIGDVIAGIEDNRPDGHLVLSGQPAGDLVAVAIFDRIVCPSCETVQGARIE